MKKTTTVITNSGMFIELKNPRLMSLEKTVKYESLANNPTTQALFIFESCLVNKSDIDILMELSIDEISWLLEQMVIDFSEEEY